jgi:hypothetical protein
MTFSPQLHTVASQVADAVARAKVLAGGRRRVGCPRVLDPRGRRRRPERREEQGHLERLRQ